MNKIHIFVKDGNEYVAGIAGSQAHVQGIIMPAYARLWTNGIPTDLSDGTTLDNARQVFYFQ